MFSELNRTGTSALKAVRKTADTVAVGAGILKDELEDYATLNKEINMETRGVRKEIAVSKFTVELRKEQYKIAKAEARIEAKITASGLDMKAKG